MPPKLRPSVRAIIVDEDERVLLCRFAFATSADSGPGPSPRPGRSTVVWAAPGGGVKRGEDRLAALRRELREEVGLTLTTDPPHVWHQEVVAAGHAPGYDGIINDYFLVRAPHFQPRGEFTDAQLAAENLTGFRWWRLAEIAAYRGPDLFSPRDLATPLSGLLTSADRSEPVHPVEPVQLGL